MRNVFFRHYKVRELRASVREREQEVARLREGARSRDIREEECAAKLKALDEQLAVEQRGKMQLERVLDQHKLEIRELQTKLDECVDETKKLDLSIRAAARFVTLCLYHSVYYRHSFEPEIGNSVSKSDGDRFITVVITVIGNIIIT